MCSYTHCNYINIYVLSFMLTRALQSTYPMRCICMYLRAAGAALIYRLHFDDLYLHVRMPGEFCTWAESTWPAVAWEGAVDRRGQQKHYLWRSWAVPKESKHTHVSKPVFRRFQRIHCAYESLRCLDLEIWRFSCWLQTTDDDRQNRLLYPLRMRTG